jgi:hypothetical protein
MGDQGKSNWHPAVGALPMLVIVAIWILLRIFGPGTSPENSREAINYRLDVQEAHDAEWRGDQDSAAWWYRQAKRDAAGHQ